MFPVKKNFDGFSCVWFWDVLGAWNKQLYFM